MCGRGYALDALLLAIFMALVCIYVLRREGYVHSFSLRSLSQQQGEGQLAQHNQMDVVDTRISKVTDVRSDNCKAMSYSTKTKVNMYN